MRDLPTFHPRKGFGSKYSTRVKQAALGGRRFNTDTLAETFPGFLDPDMDVHILNRENILSSSYQVENTYFVKVVTPRHLKAHQFLTWWRNTVFKMSRLPAPFESFDTPLDMVEYEYNAAHHTREEGGAIAKPYAYSEIQGDTDTSALLYEYVPNAGKVEEEQKSLKAFEHVVLTMRRLHNGGYTHTSLPFHIVQALPTGEPYITDPIGKTKDTDQARLLGIGFDIATLLARYTPHVGTLPALKTLGEHYSEVELVAAYKTAVPIQVTVPGTPPWVINHLRSSINEYADGAAVDTYLEIVGEEYDTTPDAPTTANEDSESPYSTSEFIDAVMDSTEDQDEQEPQSYSVDETEDDSEIRLGDAGVEKIMMDPTSDPFAEPSVTKPTHEELESPSSDPRSDEDNTEVDDPIESGLIWTGESSADTRQTDTSNHPGEPMKNEEDTSSLSILTQIKTMFSSSDPRSTDETTSESEDRGLPPK